MASSSTVAMHPAKPQKHASAVALPARPAAVFLLAVAGIFSILSTGLYLWDLWTTDPLKSIGAFVPLISLLLIARAWRSLHWQTNGTWWGLLILTATVSLVHWRDHGLLELVLSPSWSIFLPPHSLVAFAYVSGAVLLFGGVPLYRAALFPVLLVLLVNPVPHAFNRWVDLPLQEAAAITARGCAHLFGQQLTPDQLRLMFAPRFGMFIAPGCDGIRGAVTLGLLALVAGYLYRLALRRWIVLVVGAVLLGYVFNLIRLCVLVLYYVVALRLPWLQQRAELADYILGGALFFSATVLFFSVLRRFSPAKDLRPPPLPPTPPQAGRPDTNDLWARWAACAVLFALGSVPYARALAAQPSSAHPAVLFPARLGDYELQRTWQERLPGGAVLFDWATYQVAGTAEAVSVGVAPLLGAHDTLICHAARGEDWAWHGPLTERTADGPVSFSGTLLTDGAVGTLEASTLCAGMQCGEFTTSRRHLGLVYSRPAAATVFGGDPAKPVPILIKAELPQMTQPTYEVQQRLEARLRAWLSHASLVSLARQTRSP